MEPCARRELHRAHGRTTRACRAGLLSGRVLGAAHRFGSANMKCDDRHNVHAKRPARLRLPVERCGALADARCNHLPQESTTCVSTARRCICGSSRSSVSHTRGALHPVDRECIRPSALHVLHTLIWGCFCDEVDGVHTTSRAESERGAFHTLSLCSAAEGHDQLPGILPQDFGGIAYATCYRLNAPGRWSPAGVPASADASDMPRTSLSADINDYTPSRAFFHGTSWVFSLSLSRAHCRPALRRDAWGFRERSRVRILSRVLPLASPARDFCRLDACLAHRPRPRR
ncbi:hypothetical protein B0H10DRAFT_990182 [Mycena sp. CBHHK59/15]|nr:hypothetical protein B0H10DRAFT_990182 [Mycena sp. CBHHK59/15]